MRTKIFLIATTVLVSAGVTMHHFRYCPLQHLKQTLTAHHKAPAPTPTQVKDALAVNAH